MLSRRTIIAGLPAAGWLAAKGGLLAADPLSWEHWAARYLRDGQVIDHEQSGITHSEGQGYGLLFAQAVRDRARFAAIEAWSDRHLAVRQDNLMAWKWVPSDVANIASWHTATDGDLFRAWALLRGADSFDEPAWRRKAIAIARDIAALCLAPDPRVPGDWLLTPGAESRRAADRVLVNPSYIMPLALRALGIAADEPRLIAAAAQGETLLADLAATGFLPNWVDVTRAGFADPAEHDTLWGYDALRIPLYLAWSGLHAHPAVALGIAWLDRGTLPGHLCVAATPQGALRAQSNHAGFHAVRQAAACASLPGGPAPASYYPDSLFLLAQIAARESACSPMRERT